VKRRWDSTVEVPLFFLQVRLFSDPQDFITHRSLWFTFRPVLSSLPYITDVDIILFYHEDGGSRSLRNVGRYLPDYMVSHSRGQCDLHSHCHENFESHILNAVVAVRTLPSHWSMLTLQATAYKARKYSESIFEMAATTGFILLHIMSGSE
jgi:hypothetical protein